jgi:hypothetical protein
MACLPAVIFDAVTPHAEPPGLFLANRDLP